MQQAAQVLSDTSDLAAAVRAAEQSVRGWATSASMAPLQTLQRGYNAGLKLQEVAAPSLACSVISRPRVVVAKASDGDRKRVDWDREWSSFVNEREQQGSTNGRQSNVYTTTGSSQRRQSVPVDPAARMTRDAIKREESFLLNAWSSDKFQGAGVALAVLVLLVLLLAAGPPPADSRCTLPWC